jgi:O-antigen/teichoic acid export membrane protein
LLFKQLTGLFKNTLLYGMQDILEKVVAFCLIPVYTAFLTPDEYGIISVMTLVISVLSIIYISGQHGSALRYYYQYKEYPDRQRAMLGSIFTYLLLFPLLVSLVLLVWGGDLFHALFQDIAFFPYGALSVVTAYFLVVPQLQLTVWMASESPRQHVVFSAGRLVLSTSLILIFVAGFRWGAFGKLLGAVIGNGVFWAVAAVFLLKHAGLKISGQELKRSLSYGLPLVPHLLAGLILTMSDRYMLEYMVGLAEVGIYSLGYNLGSIMLFLSGAFDKAWFPFYFSAVDDEEKKALLPKIATYFVAFSLFVTLIISLFAREIVALMASPAYQAAYRVIPVVALGVFFNCIYLIPVKAFFYYKKTKYIPVLTGVAAVANIGLNLWLIPIYGMMGAAWATVASYFLMFVLVLHYSQKLFYINYEQNRVLSGAVVAIAVYLLNVLVFRHVQVELWQALLIKAGLIIAGLPVLYRAGFFNQQEINKLKSIFVK